MFKKVIDCLKRIATPQRVKMLSLMLLFGAGAAMAQNSAGDYTAGTTALTTVSEENSFGVITPLYHTSPNHTYK